MYKPGISATAVHIFHAMRDCGPIARKAIAEEILTFADLDGQPACDGFVEAFAGENRTAQINAANAMARNGILEPRDLKHFRECGLRRHLESAASVM